MSAYFRSGLVLVVALTLGTVVSTLPTRAADESKTLRKRVKKLEKAVAELEAKLAHVSVAEGPINGLAGPHVIFEGCNVHVRSGSGDSTDGTVDIATGETIPNTEPSGLGNLIVGYNEEPLNDEVDRAGSHNFVVGPGHTYPNVGGVVLGQENATTGPFASVTGGFNNDANGAHSSVSGGQSNGASGGSSSVSGGLSNTANNVFSSIGGGYDNVASGTYSSVSGGTSNSASGDSSCVSGGFARNAQGQYDWVAGDLLQDD